MSKNKTEKTELPKGKLSVKFSQARCVWQMYCGGEYLPLACGGYPTEAIKELLAWYAVPIGTAVTIFGGSTMGKQVVLTTRETPEATSWHDGGLPPRAGSPSLLTPETDALCLVPQGTTWRQLCGPLIIHARKLERERDEARQAYEAETLSAAELVAVRRLAGHFINYSNEQK